MPTCWGTDVRTGREVKIAECVIPDSLALHPDSAVANGHPVDRAANSPALRYLDQSRVPELIRTARHEVLSMADGGPPHVGAHVVDAVRSGTCPPRVQVRMLWSSCDDRERSVIRELMRHRVRVKIAIDTVYESLLIDRTLAVVPVDPGATAGVVLAATTPTLVGALLEAFTERWSAATEWAVACGPPDEFESSVLLALVAGMTDEAAAGRLGVSARTVRRYVSMLMDRIGARSRFELGYRAAELGWLEPRDRFAG